MAATRDTILQPKGYSKITSLNTAKTLGGGSLGAVPAGAKYALIKTETQAVRWRDDGTNPTATDGMLIDVGDEFWYTGQLRSLSLLETAASATVHVAFYS